MSSAATPHSAAAEPPAGPAEAGRVPERSPGLRAGPRAPAPHLPPSIPGWGPAHAGRLQPAAQTQYRSGERGHPAAVPFPLLWLLGAVGPTLSPPPGCLQEPPCSSAKPHVTPCPVPSPHAQHGAFPQMSLPSTSPARCHPLCSARDGPWPPATLPGWLLHTNATVQPQGTPWHSSGLGKGSPHSRPQVVCQHYRRFGIPKDLRGVWRYLNAASETKEFKYTCPNSEEIIQAYRSVVRSPQ